MMLLQVLKTSLYCTLVPAQAVNSSMMQMSRPMFFSTCCVFRD
jgi:hypothetical protein